MPRPSLHPEWSRRRSLPMTHIFRLNLRACAETIERPRFWCLRCGWRVHRDQTSPFHICQIAFEAVSPTPILCTSGQNRDRSIVSVQALSAVQPDGLIQLQQAFPAQPMFDEIQRFRSGIGDFRSLDRNIPWNTRIVGSGPHMQCRVSSEAPCVRADQGSVEVQVPSMPIRSFHTPTRCKVTECCHSPEYNPAKIGLPSPLRSKTRAYLVVHRRCIDGCRMGRYFRVGSCRPRVGLCRHPLEPGCSLRFSHRF